MIIMITIVISVHTCIYICETQSPEISNTFNMYVLSSNKTERPLKPGPWPSPVAAATGFTSLTLQLLGTFFTHKCSLLTTNNSQQVDHYFHRLFHKCILSLCTNSQ